MREDHFCHPPIKRAKKCNDTLRRQILADRDKSDDINKENSYLLPAHRAKGMISLCQGFNHRR
ncbi:MAG TPA: hypothetical protein VFP14_12590, partial [Novosphingobium sp.]|nr:hypothetical protein [Novosphingobium sp.]